MPSGVFLRAQSALCSPARATQHTARPSACRAAPAWTPGLPLCPGVHVLQGTAVACSPPHPASLTPVCAVRPSCERRWRRCAACAAGPLPSPGLGWGPRFRYPPPLRSALHRCGAPTGLQGACGCGTASPRGCLGLAGPCGSRGEAGSKPWQVRACCRHVAGALSWEALQVRTSSFIGGLQHIYRHIRSWPLGQSPASKGRARAPGHVQAASDSGRSAMAVKLL